MKVKIRNIIKTFKTEISFFQPIYEAIANSIQANANNIVLTINGRTDLFNKNFIKSIVVTDDGEGFSKDNIDSFNEYLSDYKYDLGCKGVGRFTWLKIFSKIYIESNTRERFVKINFTENYNDVDDISFMPPLLEKQNFTKVTFDEIISEKNNIEIDLMDIRSKIINYFLLTLINMKRNNRKFQIDIRYLENIERITIDDIPTLIDVHFDLNDSVGNNKYDFVVSYSFAPKTSMSNNECFLCGDNRMVEKFDLSNIFLTLPNEKIIKVLVQSKYFDERINPERTEFTFNKNENNPTISNPIPFTKIKDKIEEILDNVIMEEFPNLVEENEKVIKECIDDKPYLAKYIKSDKSLIKRKNDVIRKAEKIFEKEKETVKKKFIQILKSKDIDENELADEFEKLNDLSNRELAQYFLFRQTIIDSLKALDDSNEKLEKYLHKLFLELGEKININDSMNNKYSNCIWLLDDKFMSYENIYSDIKIIKIKEELNKISENQNCQKEPDLTIFYSNNSVVVVEFKGIGTSNINKLVSISEINRNMKIIAQNFEGLSNIYGYIITKIDDALADELSSQQGVYKIFTNGQTPIFYYYNQNITNANNERIPTHVYILSTTSIYSDANARNKTFIDIIKNI